MTIADASSRDIGLTCRSFRTCGASSETTLSQSTLWQEDSPVNPSATPATERPNRTSDGSGLSLHVSYGRFDRSTRSWRTYQGSLLSDLTMCSVTFTSSGSMRSGQLFPRVPWVRHTCGDGCSLWPTARTVMAKVKCHVIPGRETHGGANLEEVVAIRGETGGYLNPRWVEWHMGFPPGWCELPSMPSATP